MATTACCSCGFAVGKRHDGWSSCILAALVVPSESIRRRCGEGQENVSAANFSSFSPRNGDDAANRQSLPPGRFLLFVSVPTAPPTFRHGGGPCTAPSKISFPMRRWSYRDGLFPAERGRLPAVAAHAAHPRSAGGAQDADDGEVGAQVPGFPPAQPVLMAANSDSRGRNGRNWQANGGDAE